MTTQKVLVERRENGVLIITFNRPKVRNALDEESMRAFTAHIEAVGGDDFARVLILTGASAAFCAGADLVEMSKRPTADEGAAMIALMGDALLTMERLPIPVIGAINGYALGGGAEVALACDLRVVDQAVRLGFVQAKRGVIPGWGGGQRLLRLIGYARALELLLTARMLSADDLLMLGMVNAIAPMGGALAVALELADSIAALDPAVVRSTKALLRAGLDQPYDAALMTERLMFPPLWAGEARQQSTHAFVSKGEGKPD